MKILVTGATGLVGKPLVERLLGNGHEVHFLSLKQAELETFGRRAKGFLWNLKLKAIDLQAIRGVDAIIHLAGAPISKRWTEAYKKEILDSRVQSANLLYDVLRNHDHTVKHFVSASAIGIYKDSLTTTHDEKSTEFDDGFLADVVKAWEASADQFLKINIKICKIRTGLVLAKEGGALPELAKPIRYGFGAPLGSGKQGQSWVHLDDLVGIYTYAVENQLLGVYNATAPNPVDNKILTKAVAKAIGRPLWLPNIPEFVLKLMLGEMYILLVSSQFVLPKKTLDAGYAFKFPDLNQALRDIYK